MSVAEEHRDISQDSLEWQKYKLPIQHDALHDSDAVSRHTPFCHEDTRKGILKKIAEWAKSVESETIFWLHGPAGTGKSAIARTIAHQLAKTEPEATVQLGASYFFKRPDRTCSKQFFPTIAARLVHSIPRLKGHVQNSLDDCGWLGEAEIEGKDRKQQFETLILNPIKDLSRKCPVKVTRVIVIDALDECEREDIPTICTQLSRLQEVHEVRLRVLLTSRSTGTIDDALGDLKEKPTARRLSLLDFSGETKVDIEKFLKANFVDIKKRKKISEDWPSRKDLDRLLILATTPSPLFIYAATLCRHVDNPMTLTNPVRRLERWLGEHDKNASQLNEQLNQMYKTVLDEALFGLHDDEKQLLAEILRSVVLLAIPLPARRLAALLDMKDYDVDCLLPNLHAVLDVRSGRPVEILHESFRDFLLGTKGTGADSFRVDAAETHEMLVKMCINRMKGKDDEPERGLRRDMCNHGDYGKATDEIGDTIHKVIPPDLEYACLNWVHHLHRLQDCREHIEDEDRDKALLQKISDLLQKVKTFLEEHFLHWIETLSLLGRLSEGVSSIRQLRHKTQVCL
ncbi:hypothetical protein NW757_014089 [Fusarium falciforme]|nr:hypothetical protein NW757_014089 [Fusarium falciforme]